MVVTIFGNTVADPGTIIHWPNPISEIPPGWTLCDGTDGTPNLLDKFPRGATSSGSTGGSTSVSLSSSQMPAHNHTGDTDLQGSHRHTHGYITYNHSYGDSIYNGMHKGFGTTFDTGGAGSHGHSIDSGPDSTGSSSSFNNTPQYYEVAFIMKT